MRRSPLIVLMIIVALFSGLADSTFYVKSGKSIQAAINAASPGQTIEVQNGTYYERINVTKRLVLIGVNGPVIDAGGVGSAITLSANGSTILGFIAENSGKEWNDAGIKALSRENVIKDNLLMNNGNYGIFLYYKGYNTIAKNTLEDNLNSGIMLIHSNSNQIWGNNATKNKDGIFVRTSSGNIIKSNNLSQNQNGINISNYNFSESISASTAGNGKGVSIEYHPTNGLNIYNINKTNANLSPSSNIIYQNNFMDNVKSAFDDGYNQWYSGKVGNHYSNYDARETGCKDRNRDGICDSGYSIPGGGKC